mgnify:CR=1 FL=1
MNIEKKDFDDQIDYWSKFTTLKSTNHRVYARSNMKKNQWLNIPVIVINAITGTVVLSLLDSLNTNTGLVVGILNVGVGVMGLIKNFMKYEKKFNSHNDYYKKYKKLSRRLNTMKLTVLPKDYKNTIKELTTELNNLLDDEPSLPIKYMIKKTDVDKFDDDGNNNISHLCKVVTNDNDNNNNDKDDESEGFLDKIENAASKAVDFVEDVIDNHGDTIVDMANKHGEDVVDFVKDNV